MRSTASGDKYDVRFDSQGTIKGETPTVETCTGSFAGGFDASGGATFEVVGEYTLATPKAK